MVVVLPIRRCTFSSGRALDLCLTVFKSSVVLVRLTREVVLVNAFFFTCVRNVSIEGLLCWKMLERLRSRGTSVLRRS